MIGGLAASFKACNQNHKVKRLPSFHFWGFGVGDEGFGLRDSGF